MTEMTIKRKKILLLITKSNWGGAQKYVFDLATNLPPDEFDVVVALGGDGPLYQKLVAAGIRTISIAGLQRDISLTKEFLASRTIAKIIKTEKPDILHLNSSKAGFIGTILGRLLGVPKVIFTAHGWAFNEEHSLPILFLFKTMHWLTVLASHQTIAVSNMVKEQMNWPATKDKLQTVHNGATLPNFLDRTIARQKLMEKNPNLANCHDNFWSVTIAELHPVKQHNIAIEGFVDIKKSHPWLKHVIIGGGQEEQNLKSLIQEYDLTDTVFMLGYLDNASDYLKAFDLFILPSRSEGLPYAVVEALQAGLPIVASDVGGIPELVESGKEALLVPSADVNAVTAAVTNIATDKLLTEQLASAALLRSEDFSISKMIEKTIAVYKY